jgi:hypothetical protein
MKIYSITSIRLILLCAAFMGHSAKAENGLALAQNGATPSQLGPTTVTAPGTGSNQGASIPTSGVKPIRGTLAELAALPPAAPPAAQVEPFPVTDFFAAALFIGVALAVLAFLVYAVVRGIRNRHIITVGLCIALVLLLDAASISISTKTENYALFGLMRNQVAFAASLATVALATIIALRLFGRDSR